MNQKTPELIVNLSSAASHDATPMQRLAQIFAIRPEMASLNTHTMNFSIMDHKGGAILFDNVFTNTFTITLVDEVRKVNDHLLLGIGRLSITFGRLNPMPCVLNGAIRSSLL